MENMDCNEVYLVERKVFSNISIIFHNFLHVLKKKKTKIWHNQISIGV